MAKRLNKNDMVLRCFVRATKGLKTGGYTEGVHHSAMLGRARSGGESWKTLLARICKHAEGVQETCRKQGSSNKDQMGKRF